MIRIRNIKLAPGEPESALRARAAAQLGTEPENITALTIRKKSIDARKKADVRLVYTVDVAVRRGEQRLLQRAGNAEPAVYTDYIVPRPAVLPESRPVVVGFGPAGIFAGLVLAMAGLQPLILERGGDVDERTACVQRFFAGGPLDPACNVQFGEGGAGTFSDGKLSTGISDGRTAFVLQQFVEAGAPENVLYDAKPHVGTDILRDVVRHLREKILALGGELRFHTQLTRLELSGNTLTGLVTADGSRIPCRQLILATGHSARDTLEALHAQGVPMEPKAFSMGVRIEHLQRDISRAQYGRFAGLLPPADYKLNVRLPDGSSAYTFCMCPGGYVVAAASEPGHLCTNGMSYAGRSGENANAALLVTLTPAMFPAPSPLGGMYWQREIERRAFLAGGENYDAPAQLAGDFLAGRRSTGPGKVLPTYRPGVRWGSLDDVLPPALCSTLRGAIPALGRKLQGFDDPEAVLTAAETRSSSPVRITRDAGCRSAIAGLYPCGEGAGYAGGIVSAAVDGMRCAEAAAGISGCVRRRQTI